MADDASLPLPSGRLLGRVGDRWLELRVDAERGVLSLDVSGGGPATDVWARTPVGAGRRGDTSEVLLEWRGADGGHGLGALTAVPSADGPGVHDVTVTFSAADDMAAGTVPAPLAVPVARVGSALRDLGVEIEVERGVVVPSAVPTSTGDKLQWQTCLNRAGLAVRSVGETTPIDPPAGGRWRGHDILERLQDLMRRTAQSSLAVPAWEARLLLLSRSDRPGLLGVMFDFADSLPRQGAAVFVGEIAERYPDDSEARVLQSVVHELGHLLNLVHPFQVGRSESTSFMNYDWAYRGGRQADRFWNDFGFTFDPDELDFLHHGPRSAVVPGGDPFGSARYWRPAAGAPVASAGLPPSQHRGLRLWLTPPAGAARGGVISVAWGQPLYLGVSLANASACPVVLPRHALDVKAGVLDIEVGPPRDAATFTPAMRRCYALDPDSVVRLGPGQSVHDNVSLFYGSGGLAFREPGEYDVRPVLHLPSGNPSDPGAVVSIAGEAVRVRVTEPDRATRRDVDVLVSPAVAMSVVMAGVPGPGDVHDAFREVSERRRGATPDPFVSVIDRLRGIDAGRRGDHETCVSYLTQALDGGEVVFDPHTLESTRRMAVRHRAAGTRAVPPPTVVVDLAARTPSGTVRHQVAGALRADRGGRGWGVVAPAGSLFEHLPTGDAAGDVTIEADVTVCGPDGLVERLPAVHVDAIGPADGSPEVLLAWLPRRTTATATPALDLAGETLGGGRTLWDVLAERGVALGPSAGAEADLSQWAAAATGALASLPDGPAPSEAPTGERGYRFRREPSFDDVAGWACRLLWFCQVDAPEPGPGREVPVIPGDPFEPAQGCGPTADGAVEGE